MADFKDKIKNIMDSTFGSSSKRLHTEESSYKGAGAGTGAGYLINRGGVSADFGLREISRQKFLHQENGHNTSVHKIKIRN